MCEGAFAQSKSNSLLMKHFACFHSEENRKKFHFWIFHDGKQSFTIALKNYWEKMCSLKARRKIAQSNSRTQLQAQFFERLEKYSAQKAEGILYKRKKAAESHWKFPIKGELWSGWNIAHAYKESASRYFIHGKPFSRISVSWVCVKKFTSLKWNLFIRLLFQSLEAWKLGRKWVKELLGWKLIPRRFSARGSTESWIARTFCGRLGNHNLEIPSN